MRNHGTAAGVQPRMKLLLAALALLTLAGCGSDGSDTAADPSGDDRTPQPTLPVPDAVPAADGPVRTRGLATVMDTGRPELCLGAVAESYPPQCGGPEIVNWDWKTHGQGMFEQQGETRWGTFHVTGSWDGTVFEVTETVPGPLYDAMAEEPTATPTPARAYSSEELQQMAEELSELPGFQGAYAAEGHVLVEVLYDDGTLQEWADETYGAGVVLLTGLLVARR